MTTVSTQTVQKANRTANALEAAGIPVEGVKFTDDNTFQVVLADAGRVGTKGVGGGTVKEVEPSGVGGGTVKDVDE